MAGSSKSRDELIFIGNDTDQAELHPVGSQKAIVGNRGDLAGEIHMADDFSEPLEDMKAYMVMEG